MGLGRWVLLVGVITGLVLIEASGSGEATLPSPPSPSPSWGLVSPAPAGPSLSWEPASPTPAEDSVREYLTVAFPPHPAREIVLSICSACHGIGMVTTIGENKDRQGWEYTRFTHEVRYQIMLSGEEEANLLWGYLSDTFGSGKPPLPPLPSRMQAFQPYL